MASRAAAAARADAKSPSRRARPDALQRPWKPPPEKLNLVVKNESGKEPYEVEGEGGTKLEEVVVPEGKTREVGFDVPDEPGTYEIKCYVPGDIETTIEITVKAAGATQAPY